MLTNYDAKGVADVMGIAFWEAPDSAAAATAGRAKAATRVKLGGRDASAACVIEIDHAPVRIIDIRSTRDVGRSKRHAARNVAIQTGGMRSPSAILIEKAVASGLPRFVLRHVAEQIAGADKARIAALESGVVPRTTLERRERQLSPVESERTERIARLFVHARRALGSEVEAREFMTTPHPQLDGRTPIDAAKMDLATRRAEQILNALEYGLAL
jgi:putative toxin-antitoxin system antitoxin component (TIGR02293 family)